MTLKTIREFRKTLRLFEREIAVQNQSACCCNVTLSQCHVLMELDIKDGISLNTLASNVGLDKSTVSRTVENLVAQGLLERLIPSSNRRKTIISLTGSGKKVVRTIHMGNDQYFEEALTRIPEDIRGPFLEGFHLMAESLKKQNANK
jgi:DNA-binding MarR family transcriptional regulator